jgi:signal transduction histidine kinase/DNA-binding response OmpR family regulator
MRLIPLTAIALSIAFLCDSCNTAPPGPRIKIGLSQCVGTDKWRMTMLRDLRRELSFYPNVSLISKDADNNSTLQINQIDELVHEGIDLLIVSPNEARPLTPVVEELYNKGLPVIIMDRKISSSLYTAYIGGDNYEIGRRIGEYTASLFHGKGKVIEVMGLAGSSPSIERDKGFTDAVQSFPDLKVTARVYGNWLKDSVGQALSVLPPSILHNCDVVFAQNDRMALGAWEFFQKNGNTHRPAFIGVDGLPGPQAGLELVNSHILSATALYPTGGEEAIRTAMAILGHQYYKKETVLQTVIIDSANSRLMTLQANKIDHQQADIERQQQKINDQAVIYRNQRTTILVIVLILAVAILLGGIAFYSLRDNKRINRQLKKSNDEIILQQRQLLEMSQLAQTAHDAKLKFFTNISHEFRTPLTLILSPLEDLLANARLNFTLQQPLHLIHQNVMRLLRLVNQLMDFRKVELDKLRLKASEQDLIGFVEEIMEAFRPLSIKRHIDFRLISKERSLPVFFDRNMLDKVIFNLLSNAFKCTNDDGFVHITILRAPAPNDGHLTPRHIMLRVEDNGVGMTPEVAEHAFEPFYSHEITNSQAAGLGLALSKELIALHRGQITVKSIQSKGTIFEIILPAGSAHLSADEITLPGVAPGASKWWQEPEPDRSEHRADGGVSAPPSTPDHHRSVLIVEDNRDMRTFLKDKLCTEYDVLEADNGVTALQMAFDNIPDLVICDLVIPKKDGISITHTLKNDIRTSHIPVILLTARTTIEDQIEGMRNMADAYIVKPFSFSLLREIMNSITRNRELLKEHYTTELPAEYKNPAPKKPDRKFISEFTAIVETNLSNEQFSIDDICTSIGISRMQLYRKVKALLGCNINDYILATRIRKAKFLLQEGDISIAEVSYRVGFSSAAYFSTVFKSKTNMTPKEYKERMH